MLLIGVDYLAGIVEQEHFSAKMVFNEGGAIVFPASREHRDQKAEGISYEDNYRGDALAAMLSPGKIEARFHERFRDAQVARIVGRLLAEPDLALMRGWKVVYQGRDLTEQVEREGDACTLMDR